MYYLWVHLYTPVWYVLYAQRWAVHPLVCLVCVFLRYRGGKPGDQAGKALEGKHLQYRELLLYTKRMPRYPVVRIIFICPPLKSRIHPEIKSGKHRRCSTRISQGLNWLIWPFDQWHVNCDPFRSHLPLVAALAYCRSVFPSVSWFIGMVSSWPGVQTTECGIQIWNGHVEGGSGFHAWALPTSGYGS